jgi:hypothetical protein
MTSTPDPRTHAQLLAALDHALADLRDITEQRDALHAELTRTRTPTAPGAEPPTGEALAEITRWVDTWLCTHLEVQLGSRNRWCRHWPEHPAAVLYIAQLHVDYTRAVADPKLGMAAFLRNSLNYYRAYLLAPDGPFASCDPHRHEPPVHLPTTQPEVA